MRKAKLEVQKNASHKLIADQAKLRTTSPISRQDSPVKDLSLHALNSQNIPIEIDLHAGHKQ